VYSSLIADTEILIMLGFIAIIAVTLSYQYGKSRAVQVPRSGYRVPDLRELVVMAKYAVLTVGAKNLQEKLVEALGPLWTGEVQGNTILLRLIRHKFFSEPRLKLPWRKAGEKGYERMLWETRSGLPMDVQMVGSYSLQTNWVFDVTIRPVLYYRITQMQLLECTDQDIQEAQHECVLFAERLRGIMAATELQPPSVSSFGPVTDVRRRLIQFGLNSQADLLAQAETKIPKGEAQDAVKNCRSAVEQVTESLMMRQKLLPTNSFKNNLERLVSKKYIDGWASSFIHDIYYSPVSQIAHDKDAVGPQVAKYLLRVTEDTISFLLDRIS